MAGGLLGSEGRRHTLISGINVTPLVDIMLVLLIIFMVTATYIVRDAIEVNLPKAATGEPTKATLLSITLESDKTLSLNGERISDEQLLAFIREQRAEQGNLEAVIAADTNVPHGEVVRILDLVRAEGVRKFAINVLRSVD